MYTYKGRNWQDEADLLEAGLCPIGGADEAGRGSLAGPVVVASVVFEEGNIVGGLKDSKALSASRREALYNEILSTAASVSITASTNDEIDSINIYEATKKCILRSVTNHSVAPLLVFVDGVFNFDDSFPTPLICVPGGDGAHIFEISDKGKKVLVGHHFPSIAAASIVAKVFRDLVMVEYDQEYPGYGFAAHKGYGTKMHLEALSKLGPTRIHRTSFGPVKRML